MGFLILPDRPLDPALTERLAPRPGDRLIPHASGRPWLVGTWPEDELTLVAAGPRRLAVLGRTRVDTAAAERTLGGARTLRDLDAVARTLPGAFHLAASMDGRTRGQGTVSTARQVFFTTVAGTTVAATVPTLLTALTGVDADEEALAVRLLTPLPWPLLMRSVWSGVTALPVGHWLETGPDGRGRPVRWWDPPAAEASLEEAADRVRAALHDAVTVRTRGRGPVSADLSGGMDSTSLCFLAGAAGADLVTYHWSPLDRANDDADWARRATRLLPAARHRGARPEDGPTWYEAGPEQIAAWSDPEAPLPWHRNRAPLEALAGTVAAEGATLHLTGVGGDQLFGVPSSYLWWLVRAHPLRGLPVVRRVAAVNRWRTGATVRALLDRSGFAEWLRGTADRVGAPPYPSSDVPLRWRGDPRAAPWMTERGLEIVRAALRGAADAGPSPLDPDRVRHQTIEEVVQGGCGVRQLDAALARFGIGCDAPYLDDRVVEAALSARTGERVRPGRYKPLLAEAMRDVVPAEILGRRSKGEFSAEAYAGLERNRPDLVGLCDDLRLARLGLVDAGALRTALRDPGPESRHLTHYDSTLACEVWLRARSASGHRAAPSTGGRR